MNKIKKFKGLLRDRYTLKIIMIVILFILFFGGIAILSVYQTATQKMKSLSNTISENNLLDLKNIVESYLQYCDDISINLCLNDDAIALANTEHMSPIQVYRHNYSLIHQLNNIKNSSLLIDSVYLYYPAEGKVIYDAQYNAGDVTDLNTFSCDNLSSPEASYFLTRNYSFSRHITVQPKDTIKIVRPFPQDSIEAYVILNMSAKFLRDTLSRYSIREQEYFVYGQDNQVLLSSNNDPDFILSLSKYLESGEPIDNNTVVGVLHSAETSLDFVSTIPTSVIVRENRTIFLSSLAFMIIMILAGFVVSILLTIQASKPLTNLFFKLNGSERTVSTIEEKSKSLGALYQSLNANNISLTEYIDANIPALQERFFICLFFNRFKNNENLLTAMKNARISFDYPKFVVCLFSLEFNGNSIHSGEYLSSFMSHALITDSLNQLCPHFVVQMELSRFVILFNCKESTKLSAFVTIFSQIIEEQKKTLNIDINAGISDFADSILSVPEAYSQACSCLDSHSVNSPNGVVSYSEISISPANGPIYPFHLEQELMAAIKTKPDSEILEVLQELESHFQENQEFSFTTVRYIYLSLLSNIKKILYEISNNSDEWEKIDDLQLLPITSVDTIPTCIHNLGQAALFINHFIQDKSKNKKNNTVHCILEYIEGHYNEPTLSTDDIAGSIYISNSHLYALLKEIGLTPIGYLNEIRCKKAAELLIETTKTAKDIASCCGFENTQIFYRQFKKYFNLSPTQYRQLHK